MVVDQAGPVSVEGFQVARVVDPVGAGDAFAAGFLSAHLDALGAEQSLERGHALAAMVCLTHGDWEGLPTRRQLEEFLARRGQTRR
jgi:2-dehydro-3-deoxygluconokinase